ncbi:MAG: hypothetical protein M3448_01440 [Pseudomonadota bacterium]|nr:hypothetical protein [Sphingomonas sp.]MDQ3482065.1 hypothetical protein [Pseudomonadota bacterium]
MNIMQFKSRRAPKRRRITTPSLFQLMTPAQSQEARLIARREALAILG